uniref:Odorant receptor n=1 Tax=Anopheles christyi TaxID=43041 RepID=A0A182K5Q5_9DIPT
MLGHVQLLGLDVLEPSWKVTGLTVFTFFMFFVQHYASFSFLTTHLDMFDVFTECFSISAVGLEIVIRIGLLLHHRKLLNETIEMIRNQNKLFGNSEAIKKLATRFHKLVAATLHTIAVIYLSTMMFELIPIVYPDPKKSNLPLALYIPYLPHDGAPYWHLNYAFHTIMNFICVSFLLAVDGMLVLSIMAAVYQIKELKVTIQELDTGAEQTALNRELVRIIQIHQSIKHFVHQLEQTYYLDLMVDFGFVCLILCMGLNVIAVDVMHPIGFFLMSAAFQLFILCFCGNLLLIESDSLSNCAYSIDWHVMPVPEQKLLMVLIAHAQKPQVLRGIFMPLIMSSFISVIKASYSYFTLLH